MILDYNYDPEDEYVNRLLKAQNSLMEIMENNKGENYLRLAGKIEGLELAIQYYLEMKSVA